MQKEDLENILTAIHSQNWPYVVRNLPRFKHDEQYLIVRALSRSSQTDLHLELANHLSYLRAACEETAYTTVAAVTILRSEDAYPAGKLARDNEEVKLRVLIDEMKDRIWTTRTDVKP